MSNNDFRAAKVVAHLPEPPAPDTVYFVRRGEGFDIKVTNGVGEIKAFGLNFPAGGGSAEIPDGFTYNTTSSLAPELGQLPYVFEKDGIQRMELVVEEDPLFGIPAHIDAVLSDSQEEPALRIVQAGNGMILVGDTHAVLFVEDAGALYIDDYELMYEHYEIGYFGMNDEGAGLIHFDYGGFAVEEGRLGMAFKPNEYEDFVETFFNKDGIVRGGDAPVVVPVATIREPEQQEAEVEELTNGSVISVADSVDELVLAEKFDWEDIYIGDYVMTPFKVDVITHTPGRVTKVTLAEGFFREGTSTLYAEGDVQIVRISTTDPVYAMVGTYSETP